MSKKNDNNGVYVGIDLGTNNSCIAVYKYEKTEVLAGADGSRITPSYVYIGEKEDDFQVGKSAKNYGHKKPERLFYDIKRLFAAKATDQICKKYKNQWTFEIKRESKTGYCNYKIDGKIYTPETISAEVLKKLVSYVGDEKIEGVVITVPAYFSSEQKNKIMEAAKLANLNVLQLVCEPTAAAIAYGMEHSYVNGEMLFVFDMGGGTFDITVIKITNSKDFTVVALGGNSHLGGRDFDGVIVDWMLDELEKMEKTLGKVDLKPRKKYKMSEMAKEAKEALSQAEDAVIQFSELHNGAEDKPLTRQHFEELSKGLLAKVKECIVSTLKCKALNQQEINHVLFVGGASKMPMISKLLKEFFNEAKFSKTVNAEEIVALGATRLAAKIGNQSTRSDIADLKIKDAISLMIGMEVFENGESKFKKIFDNNSSYEEVKTVTMRTTEDNQKKCEIPLYEGLSDTIAGNSHIGSIRHNSLPQGKAGEITVDIQLSVDRNGILKVIADENCEIEYKTQVVKKV